MSELGVKNEDGFYYKTFYSKNKSHLDIIKQKIIHENEFCEISQKEEIKENEKTTMIYVLQFKSSHPIK